MADLQSIQYWLWQPDSRPVVLVDLVHSTGIRRVSTFPYCTRPNDVPANKIYDDVIDGGITLASVMGDGQAIGEMEFYGLEGEEALNWQSYQMWLGDLAWPFSQFAPLAAGVIKRATRPSRKKIRLEFVDPADRLKTPALTAKTGENLTPLVLGSVLNISPVVQDAATATYRASLVPCTFSQIRDSGMTVSTTSASGGAFTLTANPIGQVTCDASNAYDTVLSACNYLAGLQGMSVYQTVNFGAFQNTAKVGLYVADSTSIWDLMLQLCESIGAFPRFDALGRLELVHVPHAGMATVTLEDDDIVLNTLQQNSVIDRANVQLNYRKNWTVQEQLAGGATVADREFYARPHASIDINNGAQDLQIIDTLLTDAAQANAEAVRRGALWSQQRETWIATAVLPALTAQLGNRCGLVSEGVLSGTGTVTAWKKRADRKLTELEIML